MMVGSVQSNGRSNGRQARAPLDDDVGKREVVEEIRVYEPKLLTARIGIIGIAPLSLQRFGEKQRAMMEAKMQEGDRAKNKRSRAPRDFDADYEAASYRSGEGWYGFPASSIRNASISACRVAGIVMTRAKLTIFCEADGFDAVDNTPLVRITEGDPTPWMAPVRNATGVADVRCRPRWAPGWKATVTLTWDSDQFAASDVFNLLLRAGLQVGIGEGRPDSKQSNGIGFGRFRCEGGLSSVAEYH